MKIQTNDVLAPEQRNPARLLAFGVMCVGFFIFHIWLRTLVVTRGYEVAELRQDVGHLESETTALRVEKSRLMSPARLENLVNDMRENGVNFRPPDAHQLFYAQPGN